MNLWDFLNVRRVLRRLASQWDCPVFAVKLLLRGHIKKSYEIAMSDPSKKALWDQYFPAGMTSPNQFILRLGHAHENGEYVPFLLQD